MLRILIVDQHEVVRLGLKRIFETQPEWSVVAECCDGRQVIANAVGIKPHICVLDHQPPSIDGLKVAQQLRKRVPGLEILVYTIHDNDTLVHQFLEVGARGYLLKSDAKEVLIEAVTSLAEHRPFLSKRISERLIGSSLANPAKIVPAITQRQRSIVQLIADGHTSRDVAQLLNINLKTVESHRYAIMRKLRCASTADLVRYAVRNNIVSP
jgi:DNA-binding NarL/FixJ family response regulator